MRVTVIRARELDANVRRRWTALQDRNPVLGSPCFTPQFTLAVAAVRDDVYVGVIEDAGEIVGFFPFQRRWGAGQPAAGYLSDHHGVVAAPDTPIDWPELLRGCGLGYWLYDHLTATQRPPGQVVHDRSPGLDLSQGWEAYRERRRAAGSKRLAQLERLARKMERELGPLRLEAHSHDDAVLDTVIRLKSEQCRRTGARDCFEPDWARGLIRHIAATDEPGFGGRLSALYAGDELVAAHFGMRSQRVWHWWFPVYERRHGAYSPGAQLLVGVAQVAANEGHQLLDLGKGDEPYKDAFADASLPLLAGCIARPSASAWLRRLRKDTGRWVRTSPLAQPVRPLLQHLGRLGAIVLAMPGLLAALLELD